MANPFRDLLWTLRCLTAVPLGRGNSPGPSSPVSVAIWFPVTGMAIGVISAAVAMWVYSWAYPMVAVALGMALNVMLTGGLHLDGLADTADGVHGGWTRDRRLEIMRDSHVGVFGVTAIVMLLLVKFAALAPVSQGIMLAVHWAVAATLSRYAMVVSACLAPYARQGEGTGKHFIDVLRPVHILPATVAALGIVFGLAGVFTTTAKALRCLAVACPAILFAAAFTGLMRRRLGGVTGDTLGAAGECTEALTMVAMLSPLLWRL